MHTYTQAHTTVFQILTSWLFSLTNFFFSDCELEVFEPADAKRAITSNFVKHETLAPLHFRDDQELNKTNRITKIKVFTEIW